MCVCVSVHERVLNGRLVCVRGDISCATATVARVRRVHVDVPCACRQFVIGARALWTFGPFPAATLIKYILILISINMHIRIHN